MQAAHLAATCPAAASLVGGSQALQSSAAPPPTPPALACSASCQRAKLPLDLSHQSHRTQPISRGHPSRTMDISSPWFSLQRSLRHAAPLQACHQGQQRLLTGAAIWLMTQSMIAQTLQACRRVIPQAAEVLSVCLTNPGVMKPSMTCTPTCQSHTGSRQWMPSYKLSFLVHHSHTLAECSSSSKGKMCNPQIHRPAKPLVASCQVAGATGCWFSQQRQL